MLLYDFFAGEGGELRRKNIEARGHRYITIDNERKFNSTMTKSILDIRPTDLDRNSFFWGSPPCQGFSVASISTHWRMIDGWPVPITEKAEHSIELVKHFLYLVEIVKPVHGWLMENPRGMLRKQSFMQRYTRRTITYCQYGETRMKPTDIWGVLPGWYPRPACKNGDPCHERAPRGSRTGTQGIKGAASRAVVPLKLWLEILDVLEGNKIPFQIEQQIPLPAVFI